MKKQYGKVKALAVIIAFLCALFTANAFAAETDGMLHIRLTRPGMVSEMSITISDEYMIKGTNKHLAAGTVLTATNENGTIILKANGKQAASGESIELLRCGNDKKGFTFTMPALNNIYCGDLNLTVSGDVITPILTIYIEDYLYGVTSEAMSAGTAEEALKAEAVAARSFILCKRAAANGAAYEATDSTADQLFNGYDPLRSDAVAAVDETAGQVLYSDGAVAPCYTTASNGGQTESAENVWGTPLSCSVMKNDSYDLESANAAVKTATLNKDGTDLNVSLFNALIEGMAQQLEGWGLSTSANDIEIVSIDAIDLMDPMYEGSLLYQQLNFRLSVRSVNLSTGKPVNCSVTVAVPTYSNFEKWYNLSINSTDNETVSVAKVNDEYKVMFRREGHGIGLSCCGAQVMASAYGKTYRDILDFYYPGTELKTETLKREDNGSAQENAGTSYALPTLVPRATVEPTPEPTNEPTQEVTWTTPEPQITDRERLFFSVDSDAPSDDTFITGETTAAPQTDHTSATATLAPTIPALQTTEVPKTTATPDATEMPEDLSFLPDEISIDNLDIMIDDIDYDVGKDDGLGALDTNGDPDLEDDEQTTRSSEDETDEDDEFGGFDEEPEYDINTDIDDETVLGPMVDDEEETAEADAMADMKEAESALYGVVTVEEGSTLTLRSEPAVTSVPIAYIANGEPVRVLAYNSKWLRVKTVDGEKGYLSRAYVEKISESEALALAEYADEEDTDESTEETLDDYTDDELSDYSEDGTDIVICDIDAKTTANVRLHENPSLTSFTLMTIAGGETVNVTAYNDEWAYVEYSGVCGYIYREYLKKA